MLITLFFTLLTKIDEGIPRQLLVADDETDVKLAGPARAIKVEVLSKLPVALTIFAALLIYQHNVAVLGEWMLFDHGFPPLISVGILNYSLSIVIAVFFYTYHVSFARFSFHAAVDGQQYIEGYYILYLGGARGVMVIVVGNGHGDTSSNPGRDWLHFT